MGRTWRSEQELRRAEVRSRVQEKDLKLVDAAGLLGRSYRQTQRVWRRCREGGARALQHGNAGGRWNRAQPRKFRERVMGLVRKQYGGEVGERFGPIPQGGSGTSGSG